jgi:hypothetical protein
MTYLNCPQCALSVPERDVEREMIVPCPRCQGQTGQVVPMYRTDHLRPPVSTRAREPQTA